MMEYTIFGESHGPAVGVLIQNIPAGLPVDGELIHADLLRRKASGALATGRHEPDEVELLAGVYQGRTTGDALVAVTELEGGVDTTMLITVEREGSEKPVCVVESLSRYLS